MNRFIEPLKDLDTAIIIGIGVLAAVFVEGGLGMGMAIVTGAFALAQKPDKKPDEPE